MRSRAQYKNSASDDKYASCKREKIHLTRAEENIKQMNHRVQSSYAFSTTHVHVFQRNQANR